MSAVTVTSQRMAAMPFHARVSVSAACRVPVLANVPGNGLTAGRPWDLGIAGFTAKQYTRHLGSRPT